MRTPLARTALARTPPVGLPMVGLPMARTLLTRMLLTRMLLARMAPVVMPLTRVLPVWVAAVGVVCGRRGWWWGRFVRWPKSWR
ncbi:hypothetical protein [Microbispora hainanensis]|uniref:hypothetical protein n=1 Tax=Microbispora hainanensis TaxID=568844 RepID=UPI00324761CF